MSIPIHFLQKSHTHSLNLISISIGTRRMLPSYPIQIFNVESACSWLWTNNSIVKFCEKLSPLDFILYLFSFGLFQANFKIKTVCMQFNFTLFKYVAHRVKKKLIQWWVGVRAALPGLSLQVNIFTKKIYFKLLIYLF